MGDPIEPTFCAVAAPKLSVYVELDPLVTVGHTLLAQSPAPEMTVLAASELVDPNCVLDTFSVAVEPLAPLVYPVNSARL
jgi:hypothetical protein